MADSAPSTDLLERYGAIEQAYCEESWSSVIHDGQTLLGDLSRSGEDPPEGLKERLQLLMAHAFLYGLGDRDSAEDLYQDVLRSGAEASLRQIAEQGLQQCALPGASPESQEPPEPEMDPLPDPATPATVGASVWPEAAATPPADPAIPPQASGEPSPQEGSTLLQGLQDDWGTAASQPASSEDGALGWLTVEAKPIPQDRPTTPVMPWLETAAAVTSTARTVVQPEQGSAAEDPAVPSDEEQSAPGSPASGMDQTWDLQAAAHAETDPSTEAPPVVPAAAVELSQPVGDDAPPLSAQTAASLQPGAPGFEQSPDRPEPEPGPDPAAQGEPSELPPASPEALQDLPSPLDAGEAFTPALSHSMAEERLVPDVVDEPELIELHQADSLHREELLVQAVAEDAMPLPETESDQGPLVGLDRRGSDGMSGAFLDRREEPPLELVSVQEMEELHEPEEPEEMQEPMPVEEPVPVSADSSLEVVAGNRLFSGPPEPVAEEDPELLMGLLKVEMG